ncbi:UDP-N-acetylglucosamine 2-epimerase (non-hydrolyzing) [Paracoccus jeotgali]|uniref:UDP-N-acetylglucosamine 2-epimerase (non-hydrolyzing) n=2 Tax=Paracoccus jeotgali TaxID=2065379 RepID=A0A2K9MJS3_9RHOB|nr:UDP-N-acetylglucosamine 2-epimerase (non-hydrolyzing) [Paracoccus jeotgali]
MRTQALVSAMQAQGRSVVCLTKPGFPWDRGHADAGRQDRVGEIVYHRTGEATDRPARLPADYLAAEAKVFAALSPLRPRWVMAASNYTTAIPALFAARRLGLPFVYEVRGFWELSRASREPGYMDSLDYRAARDLDGAVAAQADLVFTLNSAMRDDLIGRGVDPGRIALLPNAADTEVLRPAPRDAALSRRLGLPAEVPATRFDFIDPDRRIILVTGHRRESFGGGFERICQALRQIAERFPDTDIVYPMHMNPNVREPVGRLLGGFDNIHLIEPLDYLPFVWLMSRAHLILTDSGGIQEEAPSLSKPVLVMRDTTERPEAVDAGTVRLVGTDTEAIVRNVTQLLEDQAEYDRMSFAHNPYGDGQAVTRILDVLAAYKDRT